RRPVRGRVISWLPFRSDDEDDEQDPIALAPSFDPQPPRKLEIAEAMDALEKAIETLPRRQQQVFMLRTLEGLDVAETATAMGCSEGSVKTHYFRALGAAGASCGAGMSAQGEQLT